MATYIFISHSSHDQALAERLVDLLRIALRLPSSAVRCTSVDGHRLPPGTDADEQLRSEVLAAAVLIGLISDASYQSAYVLFELGARWGTGLPLIPLLAPGMAPQQLRGPITGLNAVRCDSPAEVHQLIDSVGEILGLPPEPAAAFQRHVEALATFPPAQLAREGLGASARPYAANAEPLRASWARHTARKGDGILLANISSDFLNRFPVTLQALATHLDRIYTPENFGGRSWLEVLSRFIDDKYFSVESNSRSGQVNLGTEVIPGPNLETWLAQSRGIRRSILGLDEPKDSTS